MSNVKVVALVQARMGATRLPGKMLRDLHGYPIVEWVYRRVMRASAIDQLVFAIPSSSDDDPLARFLESIGATVFRGSEDDVLNRLYQAAEVNAGTHVLRLCADNPLICPSTLDDLIEKTLIDGAHYGFNADGLDGFMDGLANAELCTQSVLRELEQKTTDAHHREHVFGYLHAHREQFRIFENAPTNSEHRGWDWSWDLDTNDDYQMLSSLDVRIDTTFDELMALAHSIRGTCAKRLGNA